MFCKQQRDRVACDQYRREHAARLLALRCERNIHHEEHTHEVGHEHGELAHELQRVILARVYFVYVHDKGSFNVPDSESAPALFARPPFAHRAWHCGFDATVSHRRSLLLTTRLPAQGGFCEDIPYIFYVGNEGGGLDSIVSSVGAAYIRNRGRGAAIHIPIMCAANRA